MIYITLSVLASTLIFVIFKIFTHFEVNLSTAIVINYFTAFALGILLFPVHFNKVSSFEWMVASTLGMLFITLFNVMGLTTKYHNVMLTSVSNKMSLLFPALAGFLWHGEEANIQHITGILLGMASIVLINLPKKGTSAKKLHLPVILFLGSGVLDTMLDYASRHIIAIHSGAFSALIFGFAGVFGAVHILATKAASLSKPTILGGLILGITNFFSIFLLFQALDYAPFSRAVVFPVNNTGIVMASALAGLVFFQEKVSRIRALGLAGSVVSLVLLAWNT
jgi:drug/metabolite transporter (DMT)-like permease